MWDLLFIVSLIGIVYFAFNKYINTPYCNLCHSRHNGKCIIELRGDDKDSDKLRDIAHEIWATSQLVGDEGIEDGIERVESYLKEFTDEYLVTRNFLHKNYKTKIRE